MTTYRVPEKLLRYVEDLKQQIEQLTRENRSLRDLARNDRVEARRTRDTLRTIREELQQEHEALRRAELDRELLRVRVQAQEELVEFYRDHLQSIQSHHRLRGAVNLHDLNELVDHPASG